MEGKNAIESLIIIIKEIRKNINITPPNFYYDLEKYYSQLLESFENEKQEEIRKGFESNLRQGIKEGLYRENLDIELISVFYSMQIRNTFIELSNTPKKYSKKQLLDFFIEMIFRLIVTDKGQNYLKDNYYTE